MGFFKLGGMTVGSVFKKPETLKYPFETKEPYARQKGVIVNAKPAECTLCGVCEKRCPANAIKVDREKRTWAINHLWCIQCDYCEQGCPKKCLVMKSERPGITATKEDEVIKIPEQKKAEKTEASAKEE